MPAATVSKSVRALLDRLIDYAGLFPPAKLDMASTVRNYASYRRSADAWMLGRLIVPVARLDDFEQSAADLLPSDEASPWLIGALAGPVDQIESDVQRIESFNIQHEDTHGRAIIDVVEIKADSTQLIDRALTIMPPEVFPFFEIPIGRDPRALIEALAGTDAGAKIRTGGETAEAYPSAVNLARFIATCAEAGVPFKATAGLHHPLRHASDAVKADEFGFLNVFLAGCFALTHELDEAGVRELLEERSLGAFSIDDDEIAWGGHRIQTASIEDVRAEFAMSFGSCSFDEPRDALRALGLL